MTFTFYKNTADNRVVDKTAALTQLGQAKTVIFKDTVGKGDPSIELAYDSTILDANYAYCSEDGYYYYLGEPFLAQQRITFPTTVDLLMTYKTQIQNLTCIIGRQESKYNAYLNDDRYPVLNKQQVNTLAFPTGFANGEDILLIVNGS